MSVQSQIVRIEQNVANTYNILEEAGATMPQTRNSANLPGTAASISAVLYGKAQTLTEAQKDQARTNIGVAKSVDAVPDYWQNALDEGVEAINTAIETAGRNKSAFLFYTDAHWGYGSGMSPALLKYLGKHTAMNKTVFGGDFSNNYEYPDTGKTEDDWIAVMRSWKLAVRDIQNHHSVIGNHDYNGSDGDVPYLADHLYGFAMAPEETPDIVRGGDYYYYIDDPNEKTRYLYLNTSFCVSLTGSGEEGQGQFVADSLASTPEGWHIVPISHIWFLYADTATPTVGSVPNYCKALLNLFDSYNDRGSGTIAIGSESVSYDFADKTARVEFCIGGHTHVDYDFTSDRGIPVILAATDSYHLRGSNLDPRYLGGTTDESSVSGIIADYSNHKIHVVRIGRGVSRVVEITNYEVSYTNVLPSARAADGITVYNGVGYKKGVRWSSSGNNESTSNASDLYLTGYIPVTKGDVVYLKNVTMNKNNSNTNACAVHHFASLTDTNEGTRNASAITNYAQGVWDADGNLVQFTIPHDSENFIRLQGTYFGSDSIITINEPIE